MSVPILGFGTAPMLGRISRRQSLDALEYAFDNGIRHFDTARSYGWGEAERLLGEFLRNYPRDSYVLVSKCGIVPVKSGPLLRTAKAAGRTILRALPSQRKRVQKIVSAGGYTPSPTYDLPTLRESLERSLEQLNCSWLDVLLLHHFDPETDGFPAIIDWMKEIQKKGLIRRYGVCVGRDLAGGLRFLDRQGVLSDCIVQVPVSRDLLQLPDRWKQVQFIAHSPFRSAEVNQSSALTDVLTSVAQSCRCAAVVCSMYSRPHIEQNLRAYRAVQERGE